MTGKLSGRDRRVAALFALVMVVVIVGVDLLFFRGKTWTWERLAANVGLVLLFGAFYFRFPGSS
jgi:hypothetical protein